MNMLLALPEITLLTFACVTLLVTLYVPERHRNMIAYGLSQLALVFAFVEAVCLFHTASTTAFSGMFVFDRLAAVLKPFILVVNFIILLFARYYLRDQKIATPEYYVLSLFAVLGMLILVSANHLITLYLGLEILSLPLYALVACKRDSVICSEAAMKFFVMGALASGILLYGMSMLYGATQHLELNAIAEAVTVQGKGHFGLLVFGMVFVVVGIVFKFGAVPFHLWVPDTYEGAPTSVTMLISSAPKIAAIGLAFRLLVIAMPGVVLQWQQCLLITAILSMGLGNIAALAQTNIKRMLAYSSIAHMGYLFLGFVAMTSAGYNASIFYIITYALMAVGAFGLLAVIGSTDKEIENINDLRGLNQRNPWLAFVMLIFMFSMAGIPPTVGFIAKLMVLQAIIHVHLVWLAALALIFSVIGAYYYINVIKVMYFESADESSALCLSTDACVMLGVSGLAVLWLGFFPGALLQLCNSVFQL